MTTPIEPIELNPKATNFDAAALVHLKFNQRQLDMDGCEVGVSRQALDELIVAYEALTALSRAPEAAETKGPYEARICKGIPASCCDYGVISLSEGREVCRVWREQDARAIAAALATPPAPQPALSLIEELTGAIKHIRSFFDSDSHEYADELAFLDAALASAKHFKEGE